jgi:predicted ATPase
MTLELKNIGMIKEANVKIDGLTVIAGENDTGKSTVGKALFMLLYHINHTLHIMQIKKEKGSISLPVLHKINLLEQSIDAIRLPKLIFDNEITNSNIKISYGNSNLNFKIDEKNTIYAEKDFLFDRDNDKVYLPVFIETPLVWNFNKFFNQMSTVESHLNILGKQAQIDYPFLLKDLNFNLSIANENEKIISSNIKDIIYSIIKGIFKKDEIGNFYFERENKKISLKNTATGIKTFGILQVLLENNYLKDNTILILDEPEVHLHPKWQLEMAKVIVELVKNGVRVLVNSHSPYMIEALELYASKKKINSHFYLAEKKDNYSTIIDVTNNLEPIYSKLAKPIQTLEEESLENFKW